MIIHDHEPGSGAWMAARCGKVTASEAHCLLTAGRAPYIPQHYRLAAGYTMPSARARKQREIVGELSNVEMIRPGWGSIVEPSSARTALLEAGTIVPCEPAPNAEPIIDPPKLSEQSDDYMSQLLAEWATGEPDSDFMGNFWTDRGSEFESEARAWFSVQTGLDVETVGFCEREDMPAGCSPDGMVFDVDGAPSGLRYQRGGLELKVPKRSTHVGWWRAGEIPRRHVMQVQFSLWVTGSPLWYFMSYCPELPEIPLLLEIEPDAVIQSALDEHVPEFVERMMAERARMLEAGVVPREGVSEIAPPEEEMP